MAKHKLRKSRSTLATTPPAAIPPTAPATSAPAPAPAPEIPVLPQDDLLRLTSDPETFFRTYLGHHCRNEFNAMHQFSFAQYKRQHEQPLPGRQGRRLAIAAPRGAAKSTVHSLLFPIMDILSGRERHQVIISATMQQAKNRLATIVTELRTNMAIREAFFGGRAPRFKSNSKYIEIGKCRIEAHSAGSEMRGIAHGEYRPTRIILDDVEQSNRARTAYLRNKLLTWYDEIVENLGDSYTHITIVGTILHTDSLLSTLLNRPGYKSELYKSVINWDNCPDQWRTWQRLFTDRSDPDNVDTAAAYLAQHRDAMLEGTEVFWPSKEPYEKLQERLLIMGRSAFFKEKQNSPIKDGDHIFDTSTWARFISPDGYIKVVPRALTLEQEEALAEEQEGSNFNNLKNSDDPSDPPDTSHPSPSSSSRSDTTIHNSKFITHNLQDLRYYGFLDPALGKATTRDGDYAAIVTIGQAPDNTLYVMNVWMEKASPMKQVEQVFALHQQYRYQKFGFESNGFQETLGKFIRDKQSELRRQGNHWHLPIEKFNNSHSKHSRISLLEPHIIAGSILFQQDLIHEFYNQADEYNGHRSHHDDGLDALASCVEMVRKTEKRPIQQIKSVGRNIARF